MNSLIIVILTLTFLAIAIIIGILPIIVIQKYKKSWWWLLSYIFWTPICVIIGGILTAVFHSILISL